MSDVSEDFITLTPLTCVQQCKDLLDSASFKPRRCTLFFTLFGVYCGVMIFQAYRSYRREHGSEQKDPLVTKVDIVFIQQPTTSHVDETPTLNQPVFFSNTETGWPYSNPMSLDTSKENPDAEEEDERTSYILETEHPVSTASVATSTTKPRAQEDHVEGKLTKKIPFLT